MRCRGQRRTIPYVPGDRIQPTRSRRRETTITRSTRFLVAGSTTAMVSRSCYDVACRCELKGNIEYHRNTGRDKEENGSQAGASKQSSTRREDKGQRARPASPRFRNGQQPKLVPQWSVAYSFRFQSAARQWISLGLADWAAGAWGWFRQGAGSAARPNAASGTWLPALPSRALHDPKSGGSTPVCSPMSGARASR